MQQALSWLRNQMESEMRVAAGEVVTEWRARPHPFGGGYCVARIVNGKTDHLLSHIGCAPSIQSFHSRGEAQVEADRLNSDTNCPA